jgi:hypothetical protein
MANRIFRLTNGVSFGARYTVQSSDVAVSAVAEIIKLKINTGATAAGNITVSLRGAAAVTTALLITDDLASEVATKVAAGTYTGWTASASSDTVTFTATATGAKTGTNTLVVNSTGVTGTFTINTPGVTAVAGYVEFIFNGTGSNAVSYPLVGKFLIVNSSNVHVDSNDAKISYPANGHIRIEDGSTFKITAGQKISLIAQRADIIAE